MNEYDVDPGMPKNCGGHNYIAECHHSDKYPGEEGMDLAQAYVPFQRFGRLYPPEEALKKGTIFPALDRPYDWKGYKW